jgi:hypothetical protein
MKLFHGILGLAVLSAVLVALSLLGLVGDFVSGLMGPHITMDGLLLLLVCLMMGGLFTLMLLLIAKEAGWLGWLPFLRKKPTAEGPAGNPARAAAGATPAKPAGSSADPAAGQGE